MSTTRSKTRGTDDHEAEYEPPATKDPHTNKSWLQRYAELVAFKAEHGHCNVPYKYDPNPQLGKWVSNQRTKMTNGKISDERIAKLDEIGFAWSVKADRNDSAWVRRYNELVEFKQEFGHCCVPYNYSNAQLARWVGAQRYKKQKISGERIALLDGLGFAWSAAGSKSAQGGDNEHDLSGEVGMVETDALPSLPGVHGQETVEAVVEEQEQQEAAGGEEEEQEEAAGEGAENETSELEHDADGEPQVDDEGMVAV